MENAVITSDDLLAQYLRKSRGDDEDALEKHEAILRELCERNGWRFQVYKEIKNSDSVEFRPEMVRLLKDVEARKYKAVLVVDLDRLGRGDIYDQAIIRKVFVESNTLIMTPNKTYDPTDEDSELWLDMEGMISRQEYKRTSRRLQRGKIQSAKKGLWSNGKPPFPYVYNKATQELEIDPEKRKAYDYIKECVLRGQPPYKLAWDLNRQGVPSPGGKLWSNTAVCRLLTSEVHLGLVQYGKTSGGGHKNRKVKPPKKNQRDEWIVGRGTHEVLKTPEEHAQITSFLMRNQMIPLRARHGTFALSGLVECAKCGHTMQLLNKRTLIHLKTCQHADPYGNYCKNSGCNSNVILTHLNEALQRQEERLKAGQVLPQAEVEAKRSLLAAKAAELDELRDGAKRIEYLFEIGRYTKEQLHTRLAEHDREVAQKQADIEELREVLSKWTLTDEERLAGIRSILERWHEFLTSPADINRLLKMVVHRIRYRREGSVVDMEVVFH